MTTTYSLEFFNNVIFNGFNYNMTQDAIKVISELALEVGAPNYVKTPVFQKSEHRVNNLKENGTTNENSGGFKKRRGNKHMETNNDSGWEVSQPFQATKITHNTGIDADINIIRTYLNKLTDKNYEDCKNKVLEVIERLTGSNTSLEEMSKVSYSLFDIASTNRFYSTIYANLYTDIIHTYEVMREPFEKCLNEFSELFERIEYIDPAVDYDKFCKVNKDNEKRKAISAFFINLMNNNVISRDTIIQITRKLVYTIYTYISLEDKKNEVDEMSENIAILYKKELYEPDEDQRYELIDNLTITQVVEKIATSNVKEYPSITKKTIFKFMDLIDM